MSRYPFGHRHRWHVNERTQRKGEVSAQRGRRRPTRSRLASRRRHRKLGPGWQHSPKTRLREGVTFRRRATCASALPPRAGRTLVLPRQVHIHWPRLGGEACVTVARPRRLVHRRSAAHAAAEAAAPEVREERRGAGGALRAAAARAGREHLVHCPTRALPPADAQGQALAQRAGGKAQAGADVCRDGTARLHKARPGARGAQRARDRRARGARVRGCENSAPPSPVASRGARRAARALRGALRVCSAADCKLCCWSPSGPC